MSFVGTELLQILSQPPTNPGYLVAIPQPLTVVDTSIGQQSPFQFSTTTNRGLWLFSFNFNTHPLLATQGQYGTAVSFVDVTPNDNSLVVTSNTFYNNYVGVIVSGGTSGKKYTITVGITLNNSQVLSYSYAIIPL